MQTKPEGDAMEICSQIVGSGLFDIMCEKLFFSLEEQIDSTTPQWKFLSQEGLSIFLQLFSIVFLKVHLLGSSTKTSTYYYYYYL